MNLTSIQLAPGTVILLWTMQEAEGLHTDTESLGNVTYTVNMWTSPVPATTNTTVAAENTVTSWTTNVTKLIIQNLNSSFEYHWFVEVENCMGWNKSSSNDTFQTISKGLSVPVQFCSAIIIWFSNFSSY